MEIERKWMVTGWPTKDFPVIKDQHMRQGYINVHPTVRIREEALADGPVHYVLCFKSSGLLSRKEIEMDIPKDKFEDLEDLIGLPLIPKDRKTYLLPDGNHLEVNHVDEGQPTEFWYAEIEFPTEDAARAFMPEDVGLAEYLNDDVTMDPTQTMGAYWEATRDVPKEGN